MTLTAPEQTAPPAPAAAEYRAPRVYVKPEVWDREIALLMRDYPFDEVMATRLLHAAVSYLITAMETPQAVSSSSLLLWTAEQTGQVLRAGVGGSGCGSP
ncbi:hypothetical protein ACFVZH_36170 [Streptomyces sp. NPDC059534]|uniref:hypothetical protein n=1 Tax=Streptomyces sp. NPDC059534 TaxID=3346859 RepID=UPI0036C1FE24